MISYTNLFDNLGAIDPVENTNKDFQESKLLSSTVPQERGGEGFCVNYCIKTQSNSQRLTIHGR